MKIINFLCLQVCLLFSAFAMQEDAKITIEKITPNQTQRIEQIEKSLFEFWNTQKNIGFHFSSEKEREKFLRKLCADRFNELKEGKNQLLYLHQENIPVGSMFFYPSTFEKNENKSDVVINVGLVLMIKEQKLVIEAINALAQYGEEKYPGIDFFAYTPKNNNIYDGILNSQKYKHTTIDNAIFSPVDLVRIFPEKDFQWWVRKGEEKK